jgi:hypothetical protein
MNVPKSMLRQFYEEYGYDWKFPHFLSFAPGSILVFKERDCTRMFAASTLELAGKACLKILSERIKWYDYYSDGKPKLPPITRAMAEALPVSRAREVAFEELREYEVCRKTYEKGEHFFAAVKLAREKKDFMLAIALVFSRRDYEYEEVAEEIFEKVN